VRVGEENEEYLFVSTVTGDSSIDSEVSPGGTIVDSTPSAFETFIVYRHPICHHQWINKKSFAVD
jgi:hypothetical protein